MQKHKIMNDFEYKLNKIASNWNTPSKQKGDTYYLLAKQSEISDEDVLKCIDLAIEQYEKVKDESCLGNLAHCYFIKAHSPLTKKDESNILYKKSIETHIAGSRDITYMDLDFYRFYSSVVLKNIDSILKTLKLSSPSKFNDPVDCPIIQDERTCYLFPDKNVFDGIKICCFGAVDHPKIPSIPFYEDSKKWAYYGDKHKGVCIRYHFFPNELENVLSHSFVFKKIEYKSQFSFERGIVADGLLSKSDHYKEENEWRIVWYDNDYKNNQFYDSSKDCLFVPINICNIISIDVGYKCPNDIIGKVVEYAKQKKDIELPIYQIRPDSKNIFRMVREQIYPKIK